MSTPGHLCHSGLIRHPGLDPGSIFWAYTEGDGKTWIPAQGLDDIPADVRARQIDRRPREIKLMASGMTKLKASVSDQ